MAKVKIQGNASGTGVITLTAPNTSTDRTVTLPDEDITLGGGVDGIVSTADGTAITIDSSENVGIGATPESWNSSFTALQIGGNSALWGETVAGAGKGLELTQNIYYDTGSLKYLSTDEASRHYQRNGTHVFEVAPSGSADSAITFTTGLEVLNDGKARAKNGLLFGTDTAAANVLDDYEEGTWTIAFQGATFSGGNRTGYYTKVGNLVHASIYCGGMTISNITATSTCSGLPYNMASLSNHYGVGSYVHGNAVTGIQNFYLDYTNNKMYPVTTSTTSTATWATGSNKHLMISVIYRTS